MSSTQKCLILPNVPLKHTNVNLLKALEGKSMVNIFCAIPLATMILDKRNGGPTDQPIMSIGKQTIHLSKALHSLWKEKDGCSEMAKTSVHNFYPPFHAPSISS